jgi:hypothetical protein
MSAEPEPPLRESLEQLRRFVPTFIAGTNQLVAELRAPDVPQRYRRPATVSGFFELTTAEGCQRLWEAVGQLIAAAPEDQPDGVYLTVNPLDPALLARAKNRTKVCGNRQSVCASDRDVLCRRWLPIDVDPVRPSGISATDDEKAAARLVLDGVRDDLCGCGWPEPMLLDSGNGYHLWYRVDLPTEDGGLVSRALRVLATRHDTAAATIDTSVSNPSRILKLPGTWARKGDSIPERPHRMARVLELPREEPELCSPPFPGT